MSTKTLTALVSAALLAFVAAPAHAALTPNGTSINGFQINGGGDNGTGENGARFKGGNSNAGLRSLKGFTIVDIELPAAR